MKPQIGAYLCLGLLLQTLGAVATAQQDDGWELKRDRNGIQVYTRDVADSPFDAVRAVTVVDGVRLSALVALIEDYEACPHWADRCAESYVVERIGPREALVYQNNDMPFPVSDRDAVTRVIWQQDPGSYEVRMASSAEPDALPQQRGRLRLTESEVRWIFTPLPDGRVQIVNEAHINPGSAMPAWVTNMLLVDTPYETLRAMVAEVRKPAYANATVDFVREPP